MRDALRRWLAPPPPPPPPTPAATGGAPPPVAVEPDDALVERVGGSEELLLAAIGANVNTNDRALYNLLWCYRLLRWLAAEVGQPPARGTMLEIGTSAEPGLPLVSLLVGAERFVATNVIPVADELPAASVRLIYLLLSGLLPVEPARLERIVRWADHDGAPVGVLDEAVFTNLSPRPAEDIDLPADSVDVAFSFSVLEHVRQPRAVLDNVFRLLRPGGWTYHTIDLRDHRDFQRPLDFLTLSEDDYVAATGGSENRLRASQWLRLFAEAGFDVRQARFMDAVPGVTARGTTDIVDLAFRSLAASYPRETLEAVEPWVTEEQRRTFTPPFDRMTRSDLSVTSMCLAARKPSPDRDAGTEASDGTTP